MWAFAQTPRASCEMHLLRGLLNTKLMITAKESRKVLIMSTNRVNGRGWDRVRSSFACPW